METYASGTQVEVSIPLVDRGGNVIEAASVSYRVINQAGVALVPPTSLTGYAAGDASATVVVSALNNTLATGSIREARSVELTCTLSGGNTILLSYAYFIESSIPLVAGLNSFQTLEQAKLNAYEVYGIEGWAAATDESRIVALIEARVKIGQLNLLNTSTSQSSLLFGSVVPVDILGLTQAEFLSLSAEFIKALQMAQVVEASDILGYSESVAQKRSDGLMLDTIGEVKQMFRSGKPLTLPVCRKATTYLSKYLSYSVKLGRT